MGMNKKEIAEVEALRTELRYAKALRFTERVAHDVEVPAKGLATGWLPIGGLGEYPRVDVACTGPVSHATGRIDKTTSQNPRRLYSTELLALRALRNEVELRCARLLAQIDLKIEESAFPKESP